MSLEEPARNETPYSPPIPLCTLFYSSNVSENRMRGQGRLRNLHVVLLTDMWSTVRHKDGRKKNFGLLRSPSWRLCFHYLFFVFTFHLNSVPNNLSLLSQLRSCFSCRLKVLYISDRGNYCFTKLASPSLYVFIFIFFKRFGSSHLYFT